MRALNLENGVDADRILKAVAAEVESYARENGSLMGGILCLQIRGCVDAPKDNGTAPQRKARSR